MRRLYLVFAACCFVALSMFAETAQARPFTLSCYSDGGSGLSGCDGVKPPPIAACQNAQNIGEIANLVDSRGIVDAHLYLWTSDPAFGCDSFWADVFVDGSGNHIVVNAVGVWEGGCDTSNKGGLDAALPITRTYGQHESTYMIGGVTGCNYHAAVTWTDLWGHVFSNVNTDTYYM